MLRLITDSLNPPQTNTHRLHNPNPISPQLLPQHTQQTVHRPKPQQHPIIFKHLISIPKQLEWHKIGCEAITDQTIFNVET